MNKLVQRITIDFPGVSGMYCYGEASFEANQQMQEPLEKLYKYENQLDMRDKVKEYIIELDKEIKRCDIWVKENINGKSCDVAIMESRIETLIEVKNDLQSRLNEVI